MFFFVLSLSLFIVQLIYYFSCIKYVSFIIILLKANTHNFIYLMRSSVKSQQKQRSTSRSFWQQLQSDIKDTGKRAKDKIQFSSRLRNNMAHKAFPAPLITAPTNQSLHSIRSRLHQEKEIQQNIKNRAHYVNTQKDRRVQTAQLARKKYEQVKEIRSKSFREKSQQKKMRGSYLQSYMKQVSSKVLKVKSENNSQKSIQRMKMVAVEQARRIRQQSSQNQKIIKEKQKRSIQNNKKMVMKTQLEQQKSRKRLQMMKKQVMERGKQTHQFKKAQQYDALKNQQAKNTQLFYKVQSRLAKIHAQKQIAEQQLHSFRSFLKTGRQRFSPATRPKSYSSFYITNI